MIACDYASRIPRLRNAMQSDAFLVTNYNNIRYLTGFSGLTHGSTKLLVLPDAVLMVTDGRYGIQLESELSDSGVSADVAVGGLAAQKEALKAAAAQAGSIGFESTDVSWAQHKAFEDLFGSERLVPNSNLVEQLRLVKDEGEVERIMEAARIADVALNNVKPMLLDAPAENEFAFALEIEMRKLGAQAVSFESIVASGPNAAKPHHKTSDRRIEPGDPLIVDYGALYDGYHSDATRTFCVGKSNERLKEVYELIIGAQKAAVRAARAGATTLDVHNSGREPIESAGWADLLTHGIIHGIGLDVHEQPMMPAAAADILETGQVLAIEPGVYFEDFGGVRIEDTIVVTDNDCITLTNTSKDLVIA